MSLEGIPLVNADVYAESYYDDPTRDNLTRVDSNVYGHFVDTTSPFHRAVFVFLLRAGLLLIQLGSIPIGDINLILLHNLFEFAVATVAYGVVGYTLAYGRDAWRLVGTARWISSYDAAMDRAVIGWSAVVTATGIFITMVAGRFHLAGIAIVVVTMATFVDPVVIHWIWTRDGFMHGNVLRDTPVSYTDLGGCSVVHVFAGTVALLAVVALGRRLMRLRDMDECSLPPSAPATCFLGYFLLTIGLVAASCMSKGPASRRKPYLDESARILVNNVMAVAGGMLVVVLVQFAAEKDTFCYWTALRCMQGGVAGAVVVSAGADGYTPAVALLLGMAAGAVYYFVARAMFHSQLEDYCNILPIHLLCGLIGTLLPPMFGSNKGFMFNKEASMKQALLSVCWQVVCDGILLLFFFSILVPIFLMLVCFGFVHNRSDETDNRRANAVLARGAERSFMQRLFKSEVPPRLVIPGNESKDKGRRQRFRALEVVESNGRAARFDTTRLGDVQTVNQPRNTELQTYRVEVDTMHPTPLTGYYARLLQEGDHLNDPIQGHKGSDKKESPSRLDDESKPERGVEHTGPCGESIGSTLQNIHNRAKKHVSPSGDSSSFECGYVKIMTRENDTSLHKANEESRTTNDQADYYSGTTCIEDERMRLQETQNGQNHYDNLYCHLEKEKGLSDDQSGQNLSGSNNLQTKYEVRLRDAQNDWYINDGKHVHVKKETSFQTLPYDKNDLQMERGKRLREAKRDWKLSNGNTLDVLTERNGTRNVPDAQRFHTQKISSENGTGTTFFGNTRQNDKPTYNETVRDLMSCNPLADRKTLLDGNWDDGGLNKQLNKVVNTESDSRIEAHIVNVDSESDDEDDPKKDAVFRVLINKEINELVSWSSLSESETERDTDSSHRKRKEVCDGDSELRKVRSHGVCKKVKFADGPSRAVSTGRLPAMARGRIPEGRDRNTDGGKNTARADRGLRDIFRKLLRWGSRVDELEPYTTESDSSESRATSGSSVMSESGSSETVSTQLCDTSQSSSSQEFGFCRHPITTISECTEESSGCLDDGRGASGHQRRGGAEPPDDPPPPTFRDGGQLTGNTGDEEESSEEDAHQSDVQEQQVTAPDGCRTDTDQLSRGLGNTSVDGGRQDDHSHPN